MSVIEDAVELIRAMWQKIDAKEMELSPKEWVELNKNLAEARRLLQRKALLKDVAELVVDAFKQHKRLKRVFAKKLKALRGGTVETGIPLSMPKRRRNRIHNKNVTFDLTDPNYSVISEFITRVEEEAKKAKPSLRRRRRSLWGRRNR